MQQEEDTCRICSAPAEDGQPLFHPCKCSGTIRYIHQDCLTTWLAHSKKKSCDVCKHQYSFTKVYSPNMPKQLPFILFLQKFAKQLMWGALLILRGIMVACIWLAFLPYVTVWTWRFYFIVGDNIAWWINDRPRTPHSALRYYPFLTNVSYEDTLVGTTSEAALLGFTHGGPLWRGVSSDIFTGQIIASLIVLAFLGVFLLREWIMQNARPGVFDDEIHEPEAVDAPREARPMEIQIQPPQLDAPPVAEVGPEMDYMFDNEPVDGPLPGNGEVLNTYFREAEAFVEGSSSQGEPSSAAQPIDAEADVGGLPSFVHEEYHKILDDTWRSADDKEREELPSRRFRRRRRTDLRRQRDMRHHRHYPHFKARQARIRLKGKAKSGSRRVGGLRREIRQGDGDDALDAFEFTFSVGSKRASPSPSPSSSYTAASVPSPDISFSASEGEEDFVHMSQMALSDPTTVDVSSESLPEQSTSSGVNNVSNTRRPWMPKSVDVLDTDGSDLDDIFSKAVPSSDLAGDTSQDTLHPTLASYRAPEEVNVAGPSNVDAFTGPPNIATASSSKGKERQDPNLYDPTSVNADVTIISTFNETEVDSEDEDDNDWEDMPEATEDPSAAIVLPGIEGDQAREGVVVENGGGGNVAVGVGADVGRVGVAQEGEGREGEDQDAEGEGEGVQDEDMDGVLEAIGMRGPITTVFQNAALMIFVLDTTIGLGIWLPFTIGKTCALLSQEPLRLLQILHFPIRLIRFVTDPFVDFFFFLLKSLTMPIVKICWWLTLAIVNRIGIKDMVYSAAELPASKEILNRLKVHELKDFVEIVREKGLDAFAASNESSVQESAFTQYFSEALETPVGRDIEARFAWLGKHIRLSSLALKDSWIDLANGDATVNRVFSIALGYAIIGLAVALYLNILNVGSVQNAGRAVRNAIRQQLIVLKVAIFILIELVLFPLGCGIMLDLCTLQLFPNASITTRFIFFKYAPVTATFYHWMVGTMFMYQFATLLAGCRSIMRTGAMWFIKDPQDQNFHPIRDILDRPTLTQLRKLAISAMMYAVVVACGVGCALFFLRVWGKSLLPLRWKMREPLSDIPVDLLFLHVVVPPTLHHLRPRKLIRKVADWYWRWAARQLRLTSYMFGERHNDEMEFMSTKDWFASIWRKPSKRVKIEKQFKGSYRRVPAEDNIALPKELRATVAVNVDGTPIDEAGRRLMDRQNAEAEKARRNIDKDYTVVYLPPHFRSRVILFIIGLWLAFSMVMVTAIAAPIHVGRAAFAMFLDREVHDGYSFVVGFYLFWGCFFTSKTLHRMDRRRQRTSGEEPRGEWPVYVTKRALLWSAKFTWMAFWLGFVIPALFGIVMEVYLVLPLRLMLFGNVPLRIRVFESWATGLMFAKMTLATMRFRPETRIDAAITRLKRQGIRRPDAWNATIDIIAPVTGGLTAILFVPMAFALLLSQLVPAIGDKVLFLYIYPGIFVAAAIARAVSAFRTLCGSWAQSIRDSEFLVEMRLRNLESNAPSSSQAPRQHIESTSHNPPEQQL